MASISDWSVQKAVFEKLAGDTALSSLLASGSGGVYDFVPPTALFPYIVFGDMQSRPLDTADIVGREMTMTLTAYSQKNGFKEIRLILSAIYACLHRQSLSLDGHIAIRCDETGLDTSTENDGQLYKGSIRFRILTEPQPEE
jgi:hypothetical protein